MTVVRNLTDNFGTTEHTDAIREFDNTFGVFNGLGLFQTRGTSQTSIIFDREYRTTTLLPETDRRTRDASYGSDRKVDQFALQLAFFNHFDAIHPDDIQSQIRPGDTGASVLETVDRLTAEKLEDCRLRVDQTHEYMKLEAVKGISVAPSGTVYANMFEKFGFTNNLGAVGPQTFNFELDDPATDVDSKIAEYRRYVQSQAKGAGAITNWSVMVDPIFFDMLVRHRSVREAYLNASSNVRYQENYARFEAWGVTDIFTHRGVTFWTYPASFNLPDGTAKRAVEDGEGWSIVRANDLYRGFFGPANKLSMANTVGAEMYAWRFPDAKDERLEIQVQSAPLFFTTKPAMVARLVASDAYL